MQWKSSEIIVNPKEYYDSLAKESALCDLCGSRNEATLYVGDRYGMGLKTVYCKDCGLFFTNPRPVQAEIGEFYRSYYHLFYESVEKPSLSYIRNSILEERARKIYSVLKDNLELATINKVLDIGCFEGSFLKYLGERHPNSVLHGIEPAPAFAQFAASYASAEIYTGDLQGYFKDNQVEIGTYDLVILSHVLEHFLSPSEQLQRIWKLLRSDGYLYVEVPNITSPYGKLGQFHIAHLYYFYPETLRPLLLKCGFCPIAFKDKGLADRWAMCMLAKKANSMEPDFAPPRVIQQRVKFVQNKLPPRTLCKYRKFRYFVGKLLNVMRQRGGLK